MFLTQTPQAFKLNEIFKLHKLNYLKYKDDEIGDAYKFCKALEEVVRRKGGRILVKTDIKKILLHKRKVNSVVTDRAVLEAKRVVVCAGSHSTALLSMHYLHAG